MDEAVPSVVWLIGNHIRKLSGNHYRHSFQKHCASLRHQHAGSGKGTISGKILRDFHFAHISTGDLLRDEIQAGSEIGQTAKTFMDRGKFVPDEIIFEVLLAAVGLANGRGKHILLDGFPR